MNFSEGQSISFEQLFNVMESLELRHHIDEPTRLTSRSSTLIDHVFISGSLEVDAAGRMDAEGISDQRLLFC